MFSETFSNSRLCILLLPIISPLTRGVMCFSSLLSMSGKFPYPPDSFFPAVSHRGDIVKKALKHYISNHPSQPPVSADNFRNKLFYQALDKNHSFLGGKNDTGNQSLF